MITLRDTFEQRLSEFQPEYTFTEQDDVIRSFAVIGQILDLVFPGREAALTMTALRRIIERTPKSEWSWAALDGQPVEDEWRKSWGEIDGWNDTSTPPFLDELHDLNAFANFGILPIWDFAGHPDLEHERGANIAARLKSATDVPTYVEGICAKIDRLEALLPAQDSSGHRSIGTTLSTRDQARARLALDQGQPISLHALALLSGVTPKRIQNAIYAKTDEAPLVGKNGLIAPEACEPWLNAREYQWSIWKQVSALGPLTSDWGKDVPFEESDANNLIEDYVFVPVANDGTYFHPGLFRDGEEREKAGTAGFTIGPKGAELIVADFDEAVALLAKMDTPRWRRPNDGSGLWGIVSGQSWKRVRKSDLERAA